jgi:hypothetical protein
MNTLEPNETDRPPEISPWLASLMLRRGGGTLSRFTLFYQRLAALPRPWKTRLHRKLALGLTSAALLLALAGPTAFLAASPDTPDVIITVVDGEVEIAANGKCSLIEAILNAEATKAAQLHTDCTAGNLSGRDIIQLPMDGTFTLTQAYDDQYNGLPPITGAVTIEGAGATIKSNYYWEPSVRILDVTITGDLILRDVAVRGGYLGGWNVELETGGAGIRNAGNLLIDRCTVANNTTNYTSGGGISNMGTLTVNSSTISGNFGPYWGRPYDDTGGGGIVNVGTATIQNTTLDGNYAYGNGGAVANMRGTLNIINSTITGSRACYTSAIVNHSGKTTLTNTTVSGNRHACCLEGCFDTTQSQAIENRGTMVLNNTTVTNNEVYQPGGIWNRGAMDLNRSIVSGHLGTCYDENNEAYACELNIANDGTIKANNFNVFGADGVSGVHGFRPGRKDVVPNGSLESVINPLAFNGGPTLSHALSPESSAVDLAPSADCAAAPVSSIDQRGQPRNVDGDGTSGQSECDSGAVEMQPIESEAAILMSTTAAGMTTDGLGFRRTDILKWNGIDWSMFFEGQAEGLPPTADISAISMPAAIEPDVYLTFAGSVRLPGLGLVRPNDVVRWDGSRFGMFFDGSDVGLTEPSEQVDGLEVLPLTNGCAAYLLISTRGSGSLPKSDPWSERTQFRGEDVLGFCATSTGQNTKGTWETEMDGSAEGIPLGATFSLATSFEWDPSALRGWSWGYPRASWMSLYLTSKGLFIVDDATGDHSMVFQRERLDDPDSDWSFSWWFSGPYFKAADHGLLQKVDALEVLGGLP